MNKKFNWLTVAAAAVSLAVAGNAFATNGYFTHGTGTKNKSMAGSGIALPEDAIDVTNNPAVTPFVGDQLVVGAALFSPIRKYETSASMANGGCFPGMGCAFTIGPNSLKSKSNAFVIPHIAKSWQLDNGAAWALAFYGRGGMNTNWQGGTATFDPDGPMGPAPIMTQPGTYGDGLFGGNGNAGVNLSQAFLDITWAKQVNENFSFGVSAVLVAQMFEAKGIRTFSAYTETFAASGGMTMPENLSNNSTDWSYGYGLKIGIHAPINDMFSFGAMYQTKISMTEFDDYSDLFAEAGGFDIPSSIKAGLSGVASDALRVNFDVEHTAFGEVKSIANPMQNMLPCPTLPFGGTDVESCLGGGNGAGFGWEDMTTYKIGFEWASSESNTWRFGYSYGEQPIQAADVLFNILAPGVMEQHITFGLTHTTQRGSIWNFSFMYAPENSVTGPSFFEPSPQPQTIELKMSQIEFEVSYRFGSGR